jgi:hypothetical protein
VKVIKSRKVRWVEHGAHMGENINLCKIFVGKILGKKTTWKT